MQIKVIVSLLKELSAQEKRNGLVFKFRAYNKVIKCLEALDQDIEVESADKLMAICEGIGKGIKGKIDEIIATGDLTAVQAERKTTSTLADLQRIHGIGPKKSKELMKEGVKSIEDLMQRMDLLTDAQKVGVKYYQDFEMRIPRKEMDKHRELIGKVFDGVGMPGSKFEIAGSYRRGAKDSGDIDIILTAPEKASELYNDFIKGLKAKKYLSDDLAYGLTKYMGVGRLPRHKTARRVDIMMTPPDQYPFAILYFTGSQQFNIKMRNKAIEMGYSLSEHGLKVSGKPTKPLPEHGFREEKDIFEFLEFTYVEPERRS